MKKYIKAILLSLAALTAGYFAISLPFHLFTTLSDSMMEIIFMAELVIYMLVGALFLVANEKQKKAKVKAQQRHEARREKIASVQHDWYDLAA